MVSTAPTPSSFLPSEIAECLTRPATNESQARVLAWLERHEFDQGFWAQLPGQTAQEIYQWATQAESWGAFMGIVAWGLAVCAGAGLAAAGVGELPAMGGLVSVGVTILAVLTVLISGVVFGAMVLARPWNRYCNCEHVAAIQMFLSEVGTEEVKELYRKVQSSPEAVKYLDDVGQRRKYVANDFQVARRLTPGYIDSLAF